MVEKCNLCGKPIDPRNNFGYCSMKCNLMNNGFYFAIVGFIIIIVGILAFNEIGDVSDLEDLSDYTNIIIAMFLGIFLIIAGFVSHILGNGARKKRESRILNENVEKKKTSWLDSEKKGNTLNTRSTEIEE